MADPRRRRSENAAGEFYVDATCIDCDTCRWMAPSVFRRAGEQSAVVSQPESDAAAKDALHALLACPTASIGVSSKRDVAAATADFPLPITDDVVAELLVIRWWDWPAGKITRNLRAVVGADIAALRDAAP